VDNAVTYMNAKFGNDQLWNEKALVDRKSDNNTNNKNNKKNTTTKTTLVAIGNPFPGPKVLNDEAKMAAETARRRHTEWKDIMK